MVKTRDLGVFYLLTFLLLGLIPLLSGVFNNGSMDFSSAATRATEATGIEWTSNIVSVFRLSLSEPVLFLTLLGSMAPFLAAVLVLGYLRNNSLWLRFMCRLKPYQNVSLARAAFTYLSIFILLTPMLFITLEIRQATGGNYVSGSTLTFSLIPALLMIAFLDQGALLEELGWRGFAGPEMQEQGRNPLTVAIVIGLAWGLWHLPRDITTGVIERLGLVSYLFAFLPSFLLGTVSASIIAAYFMNRLGGSVIPAIIVHGISNDALGISGTASIVEALTPYHQITKNGLQALIAIMLVGFAGTTLGLNNQPPTTTTRSS